MIIVTGATGHLGRTIVERLVERVPSHQVGVSVREPDKANGLAALGVRVRQGDFNDSLSLRHAFEGANQVLIVSSNARVQGGDPLAQHRAAIDAARGVGAQRIVYTSHMAASAVSEFSPMHDHHATETMLSESGLRWTALRNGFYADSGLALMGQAFETGLIEVPEDGKVSWTAHADLAEAAAMILASEGQFDGLTPCLTASEALNFDDLAAIASELLGRTIRRTTLSHQELRARMTARGAPSRAADIVIGLYHASRHGEFAAVDPTLEQLLGRRPLGMKEVLAKHLAATA